MKRDHDEMENQDTQGGGGPIDHVARLVTSTDLLPPSIEGHVVTGVGPLVYEENAK